MKLRVGVVGVGHFGKHHIRCHLTGKFELVGFYDINKETSNKIEKEFGVKQFPSYDHLLEQCDVIDVVVPTISHFEVAQKAIRNHKHVFI